MELDSKCLVNVLRTVHALLLENLNQINCQSQKKIVKQKMFRYIYVCELFVSGSTSRFLLMCLSVLSVFMCVYQMHA